MIAIPFADLSFLPGARGRRKLGDPSLTSDAAVQGGEPMLELI
jgi:hypothetical protein